MRFSFLINRWFALLHDILWIPLALVLAYWIRFNLGVIPEYYWQGVYRLLFFALIVQSSCYWYFGLYRGIWRYASLRDILQITKAVTLGISITVLCVFLLYRMQAIPRSVLILYPLILVAGLSAPKIFYRWFKDKHIYINQSQAKRALVIGAGQAGEMLVRDMLRTHEYIPMGFIDDDNNKINRDIHGVSIVDNINNLHKVLEKIDVDLVVVSIQNISPKVMRNILRVCSNNDIECQTIPSLTEVNDDNIDISLLRKIRIDDLLGRQAIELDDKSLYQLIGGACVLVTGAGGSIGSELSRQALKNHPARLILLEQSEFNLYNITNDLLNIESNSKTEVISLLCDVRDVDAIDEVFKTHRPTIVLHAAAYKHVPIIEENVMEGVKTNIFGTKKLAEAASNYNVEKFVMVSTDKAVNPSSLMGVTKRAAEIYCQSLNERSKTKFITTRFGNVLDSTGSVVPLFREQIKNGGPVTVTHKDITRYFMSIPEAASLILQAAFIGGGGEIFVLDMGKPVKIYDLARQMIRLAGYDPDNDINIEVVGLRPGEKLYEELFHESEEYTGTVHPKILLAESRKADWETLEIQIENIHNACDERDVKLLIRSLNSIIPEYSRSDVGAVDGIIESTSQSVH